MVIKEFEEKNYMKYSVTNYKYFKKMTKKERASDTLL